MQDMDFLVKESDKICMAVIEIQHNAYYICIFFFFECSVG